MLGYSVEEVYCRLEFDFARVGSSRPDREKLPTDKGFNIRRGFFSYREKVSAYVDGSSIVQLMPEPLMWFLWKATWLEKLSYSKICSHFENSSVIFKHSFEYIHQHCNSCHR